MTNKRAFLGWARREFDFNKEDAEVLAKLLAGWSEEDIIAASDKPPSYVKTQIILVAWRVGGERSAEVLEKCLRRGLLGATLPFLTILCPFLFEEYQLLSLLLPS